MNERCFDCFKKFGFFETYILTYNKEYLCKKCNDIREIKKKKQELTKLSVKQR